MSTHWTFGKRIALSFTALVMISVALGGFAVWRVSKVQNDAKTIVNDCLPGIYLIGKIDSAVAESERNVREHVLSTDKAEMDECERIMAAATATVGKLYKDYEQTITTDADRKLFTELSSSRAPYLEARTAVVELSRAGKKAEAMQALKTRLRPALKTYEQRLEALIEFNKDNSDRRAADIVQSVRGAFLGTAIGTLLAIAIGAAAGFLVIRNLNSVLGRIIASVSDSANQVGSAAGQVSGASQSLAEGASEQAASVEETSASLEEMSSMTKNNTDHAERANGLARRTRQSADAGAVQMEEMRAAMDAIKGSSDAIAKIVSTIEEIAFQTNILALNAAVEAARAGEAGAGFAVVADEVRSLAQRAAKAAQETSTKIEDAIQKSQNGVSISAGVAKALSEIVENVRQMDSIVSEIATASREQTQGISQVNTALAQMDKVTQANAGNAEENAAAAEELNAQAAAMQEAISELRQLVGGAVAGATHRQAAPASPVAAHASAHNRLQASAPQSKPTRRAARELNFEDFTATLQDGSNELNRLNSRSNGSNGSNGHHASNGSNGHHGSNGSNGYHGSNGHRNGTNGTHGANGGASDADFFKDDSGTDRR